MTPRPRPGGPLPAVLVAATASSCLGGPQLVAIRPSYGYVDGCTPVVVSGSELGTDASITLGGVPMLEVAPPELDPTRPEHAQDVGFQYDARTPPRPDGTKGFADLVLSVAGRVLTLPEAFYYVECPGTVHVDDVTPTEGVAPGTSVGLTGCGLDPDTVTGRLLDDAGDVVAPFPIASVCGTADATFAVPEVPEGTYWIELVAGDGTTWGGACVGEPGDTGADSDDTDGETDGGDTADSAVSDTADPCAGLVQITVGPGTEVE